MVLYKQRKQRSFEDIKTVEDIIDLLKNQFHNRRLNIKYTTEKREVKINEYLEDKSIMVVTDPEFDPGDTITVYGLLDKYFEIDLKVEEVRGPGYFRCRIANLRKALKGRRDLRFKMTPEKVTATNFKMSKHTIDISDFNIPTSIKVLIDQFQTQHAKLSDIVKIDVFTPGDSLLDHVKKTAKTLFVEDSSKIESHEPLNEDFVDVRGFLADQLDGYMKKNIEKGYKSIVISPVIYITEAGLPVPFAYFMVISKKEMLTIDRVLEIKDLSFNLVNRIRDANTMMIPVHQQVMDISVGGARLMFTDENLKKYVQHAKGFVFDLVFKLQAPITIYGEIRHLYTDDTGVLFVGVDFAGNSSRKNEMKRFYSIMRPMEVDYKNRLIKEMKQRKKTD